ncbi:MAG: hypothetical protein H8F28_14515, partial [Fibrella sp.]|nr:hypothetical protein [Armatimonadota bacterium]
MRYAFIQKLLPTGICLALAATLLAYANDADDNSPTLTSDGVMTPRTRAVVSGESAYLLGPVETVADMTRLGTIATSSDGGAVLIETHKSRPYRDVSLSNEEAEAGMQQRSPEWNLVYWDVRTRMAKTLLRETDAAEWVSAIKWIPQTRIALVILRRIDLDTGANTMRLMCVDTVAGTVRRVTDRVTGLASDAALAVSPNQPLAYLKHALVKGE